MDLLLLTLPFGLIAAAPFMIYGVRVPGLSKRQSAQVFAVGFPAFAAASLLWAYARLGDTRLLSGALRLDGLGVFSAALVMMLGAASSAGMGTQLSDLRVQVARGSMLLGQMVALLTGNLFVTVIGLVAAFLGGAALIDPPPLNESSRRQAFLRCASPWLAVLALVTGAGLLYTATDQHLLDGMAQAIFREMLSVRRGLSSLPGGLTAGILLWILGLIFAAGAIPLLQWDPHRRQGERPFSGWLCGAERVTAAVLLFRWTACFAFTMQESHGILLAAVAMLGVAFAGIMSIVVPKESARYAWFRLLQTSMVLVLIGGFALVLPRSRAHVAHFHSGAEVLLLQVLSDAVLWAGLLLLMPLARIGQGYATRTAREGSAARGVLLCQLTVACFLASLAGAPGTLGGMAKEQSIHWLQHAEPLSEAWVGALWVMFLVGTGVQVLFLIRFLATLLRRPVGSRDVTIPTSASTSERSTWSNGFITYGIAIVGLMVVFFPLWTDLVGISGREAVMGVLRMF